MISCNKEATREQAGRASVGIEGYIYSYSVATWAKVRVTLAFALTKAERAVSPSTACAARATFLRASFGSARRTGTPTA
jgi:hypothetical protein